MDYCLHQSCKHMLHIRMASGYLSPINHWCQGCVWLRSEVLAWAKFLHRLCSYEIIFRMPYSAEVDIWSQVYEREGVTQALGWWIWSERNFINFMQVALKEHFWNVCRAYEIFGDLREWSQGLIVIINGEGEVVPVHALRAYRWRWGIAALLH